MPNKRARGETHTIELLKLTDEITLRIRMSVDASVIMRNDGKYFECFLLEEACDTQYTEKNWKTRYATMYAADVDGKTEEEIDAENEKAKEFNEECMRPVAVASSALVMEFSENTRVFVISLDSNVLKLKTEIDVPSSRNEIQHTKHTSIRMQFAAIEF